MADGVTVVAHRIQDELQVTGVNSPQQLAQLERAFQLQQADFKFNIIYTDPSPLNYINLVSPLPQPQDLVSSTPLLKVFNVDKLNYNNDPQTGGDGFFDFIPGLTVDPQNGRIIFTTVEPFGKHLFEKLRNNNNILSNIIII